MYSVCRVQVKYNMGTKIKPRNYVGTGREYEYERISGLTGLKGWNHC